MKRYIEAIEEGLTQGQGRDNFIKVDQGPKEGMRIEDQHQDLLIDLLHNERLSLSFFDV